MQLRHLTRSNAGAVNFMDALKSTAAWLGIFVCLMQLNISSQTMRQPILCLPALTLLNHATQTGFGMIAHLFEKLVQAVTCRVNETNIIEEERAESVLEFLES